MEVYDDDVVTTADSLFNSSKVFNHSFKNNSMKWKDHKSIYSTPNGQFFILLRSGSYDGNDYSETSNMEMKKKRKKGRRI